MSEAKKNLSWEEAAIEVLKSSKTSMHYTEIAKEIVEKQLRTKIGATPAASVNTVIHASLKQAKEGSPFLKVSPGMFTLKSTTAGPGAPISPEASLVGGEEPEETPGIIQAFGMYWRREMIPWKKDPELLGAQQQGASTVNFCNQRGVYLLHDGRETIYVGRTTDQPLGQRLFQHTFDRLATRWDRFSWFGLLAVTVEGKLESVGYASLSADQIIATMEALLIEGVEPRQNRKRGDDFRAVEYIQSENPKVRKQGMANLLAELQQKMHED